MNKLFAITLIIIVLFSQCGIFLKTKEPVKPHFAPLKLIPQPKSVKILPGKSSASNLIYNNFLETESIKISLERIRDLIKEVPGNNGKPTRLLAGLDTVHAIRKNMDDALLDSLRHLDPQGYIIEISDHRIIISAREEQGLFYGFQTLAQLVQGNLADKSYLPNLIIIDEPSFAYRAWQDDISRGPIPNMDFIKKQIKILSRYKLNAMTLYTEHVFKSRKHPIIAPEQGLSAEEISELVEFAKPYHVDIIGNFQSFGHFKHILKHPEYEHLGENDWVISPALPESYSFLNDYYSELAPLYKSQWFNINCDETWGLGEGPAKAMLDSLGLGGLYAYHINKIDSLVRPYNKKIMMWGDIAVHHREIIPELPKDLTVLCWSYGPEKQFDDQIIPFKETGYDFFVCPGVSGWGRFIPDYRDAEVNISNFIRDGFHYGALGVLNTTWDDDGENLFGQQWHPLVWGAECSWSPVRRNNEMETKLREKLNLFNNSYSSLFNGESVSRLEKIHNSIKSLRKHPYLGDFRNSHFWKNHITDFYNNNDLDQQITIDSLIGVIDSLKTNYVNLLSSNNNDKKYYEYTFDKALNILHRQSLGCYLTEIMKDEQINPSEKSDFMTKKDSIVREINRVKKTYEKLWNIENREYWLDTNMLKYDSLALKINRIPYQIRFSYKSSESKSKRLQLKTLFQEGDIHYRLSSDAPFAKYIKPFYIKDKTTIEYYCQINEKEKTPIDSVTIHPHLALGITPKFQTDFSVKYSARGALTLTDGIMGSSSYNDWKWLGYDRNDLEVEIPFEGPKAIKEISLRFFQSIRAWIFYPKKIQFYYQAPNGDYQQIKEIIYSVDEGSEENGPRVFTCKLKNKIKTEKIKIIAKNQEECPSWHAGAGRNAWMFCDEIFVH